MLSEIIGELIPAERSAASVKGFDGWMIGTVKAEFSAPPAPPSASLLRRGPSAAVILSESGMLRLRILLVRPPETAGQKRPAPSGGLTPAPVLRDAARDDGLNVRFSRAEAEAYLAAVGDDNPLHAGEQPVLPGFLILNRCLSALRTGNGSAEKAEVRFQAPLGPEETAQLSGPVTGTDGSRRFTLSAPDGTVILGICLR